jgi:murein tripeptide amidase MpaA
MMRKINLLFLLLFFTFPQLLFAQPLDENYFRENIEVYFKFEAGLNTDLLEITNIISIDNVEGSTVYAYANEKEYKIFLLLNIKHKILQSPGTLIIPEMSNNPEAIMNWDTYPTYDAYVTMMNNFAANYPGICTLVNAGISVQGRDLLLVKISDNVLVNEAEPQFLYTSTMHGDETTGYVLMLRLIDSLLTSYGTDPRITSMIDNSEIWINPNANPDGTYHGGNGSVYGATRYNANGYDLNRNFPDPENGTHPNEQQETAVMKNLAEQNNFVLCANFHGGTEVVNYPWDNWTNGSPHFISHPDETWYQFISHLYADTCQVNSPAGYMNGYDDGITNGGTWYIIHGGRQDYMNYFMRSREVTIEISDTKLPPANQLPASWEYNKRSLLTYIESIFYGARGIVTDTVGTPLNATITILNHDEYNSEVRTDSINGDYYRMLAPGIYNIEFSAANHIPKTISGVQVNNLQATIVNVELLPDEIIPVEGPLYQASVFKNEVELYWETISETNNRGFEIQRKKDSENYIILGFVQGNGTTTNWSQYSFIDENVKPGSYSYRIKQLDFDGSFTLWDNIEVVVFAPLVFSLEQNYPNPFNPSTIIRFTVSQDEKLDVQNVSLRIYDVLGNEVANLVSEEKVAGTYEVLFNATNLSSGLYFYTLQSGSFVETKKMILLK